VGTSQRMGRTHHTAGDRRSTAGVDYRPSWPLLRTDASCLTLAAVRAIRQAGLIRRRV